MLRFTLSIAGQRPALLEDLRLNLISIDRANLRPDTASLRWTGSYLETCPITDDDEIEIFLLDARVFVGNARLGRRSNEGLTITVSNCLEAMDKWPWHTNLAGGYIFPVFGSTYQTFDDPAGPITWTVSDIYSFDPISRVGTVNYNIQTRSQVYLFQPISGAIMSAQDQFLTLISVCAGPVLDFLRVGDISLNPVVIPQPQLVSDISFAEAIRRSLEMVPDAVAWFDYSGTGPPRISAARSAPFVSSGYAFPGTPVGVDTASTPGFDVRHLSVEVEPLNHLVPTSVTVRRMVGGNPSMFVPPAPDYAFTWPAGNTSFAAGALVHSLGSDVTDNDCQILAYSLYESLKDLRGQGTIVLHDPSYNVPVRPGLNLRPLDVPAALDLKLCVQGTSWSAATGTLTCQVGYPPHLGIGQILDLRAWLKRAFFGY
jgi:hypothetical protein